MGFSRQEYWSVLPCPPPGVLLEPEIETRSPVTPAFAGEFFTTEPDGKPSSFLNICLGVGLLDHMVFGWQKSSFRFFHKMLQKKPNKIFSQLYNLIFIRLYL